MYLADQPPPPAAVVVAVIVVTLYHRKHKSVVEGRAVNNNLEKTKPNTKRSYHI